MNVRVALLPAVLLCLPMVLTTSGCHGRAFSQSTEQMRAEQRAEEATYREEIDEIPPPTKSRFMAVHSMESWQNPSITVQPGMLQLYVTMEDPNPSPIGAGGMLRPLGARQHELNINLNELGEAISSVPQNAWPYGRVVALEEAAKTPAHAEPQVRRNMEVAIRELNDLGIVVYDLKDGMVR